MSSQMTQLQDATIAQHCKLLRMPTMASQFSKLAEQAIREKKTHLGYLDALLTAEIEEREKNTIERRIKEADRGAAYLEATELAGFAQSEAKRLFGRNPRLPAATVQDYLTPWSAAKAEKRFLTRFKALHG